MAAFESFDTFVKNADEFLDLLEELTTNYIVSSKLLEAVEAASDNRNSTSIGCSPADLGPVEAKQEVSIKKIDTFLKINTIYHIIIKFY